MYCAKCGAEISEEDAFCSECGSKVTPKAARTEVADPPVGAQASGSWGHPAPSAVVPGPQTAADAGRGTDLARPSIDCPRCHARDMVQKLTAIQGAATSQGVGGTTRGDLRVEWKNAGVTLLGQRLAPPSEPTIQSKDAWSCGDLLVVGLLAAVGMVFTFFAVTGARNGSSADSVADVSIFALVPLLVAGIIVWKKNRSLDQARERLARQMPLWEARMKVWDRLYYCSRCDVVFDPQTGRLAPAASMPQLLG